MELKYLYDLIQYVDVVSATLQCDCKMHASIELGPSHMLYGPTR